MTALQEAEDLRQQAIRILISEREEIDTQLARLGYGEIKAPSGKRRGRKPKNATPAEDPSQPSFRSESSGSAAL